MLLSNPPPGLVEVYDHAVEKAEWADILEGGGALAAVFPVAHLLEDHLEVEVMEGLSFLQPEVSEMQDETQEDAATSSPDPLTLDGPEDRDIDVSQSLPHSVADSSGA
jgi:hypothetical protein